MVNSGEIYTLSKHQRPPSEDDDIKRQYSDTICLTQAPKHNNPTRYFRSTYDFSSPKRFKTVVRLEPILAPIRYYRTINYGIPAALRHKSTVDCDFRPRARGFSETTWIFPKQGRDIYKSTLEQPWLVDSRWYKSQVKVVQSPGEDRKESVDYASTDEGVFGEDSTLPEEDGHNYASSEGGDRSNGFASGCDSDMDGDYIRNNNIESKLRYREDLDSMSLSSEENGQISVV